MKNHYCCYCNKLLLEDDFKAVDVRLYSCKHCFYGSSPRDKEHEELDFDSAYNTLPEVSDGFYCEQCGREVLECDRFCESCFNDRNGST
jgi:hypothetical protein